MALVIWRPILDLLNINADTPHQVSTDGGSLIISSIREAENGERFEQSLQEVNKRYGLTLKRLADK